MSLFQVTSLLFLVGFSIFKLHGLLKSRKKLIFLFRDLLSLLSVIFAIIVISFPAISTYLGNFFGIGRGVDFILYVSILILFLRSESLSHKLLDSEAKIEALVREISLKKCDKEP